MAIIDWDETPSAGDCFDETSWSNMVQYIKHSSSCTFTIYDDESSANQKFKFTYSGDDSIVEGGAVTGDDLILKSNSTDTYPKIELLGDADIKEYFKSGSAFYLYDSAVQALKVKYATNVSTIEGGHTTGDDLVLKANDADTYPKIELLGDADIKEYFKSGSAFYLYDSAVQALKVSYATNVTTIKGGTVTGDDIEIHANTVDSTPRIIMSGNGDLKSWAKVNHRFFNTGDNEMLRLSYSNPDAIWECPVSNKNIFIKTTDAGLVKFGTYTAGLVVCTGTINILDKNGVATKILVAQ